MSDKLNAEFKKETGADEICPGIDSFRLKYISWLETELEKSRSGEAELVEALKGLVNCQDSRDLSYYENKAEEAIKAAEAVLNDMGK